MYCVFFNTTEHYKVKGIVQIQRKWTGTQNNTDGSHRHNAVGKSQTQIRTITFNLSLKTQTLT